MGRSRSKNFFVENPSLKKTIFVNKHLVKMAVSKNSTSTSKEKKVKKEKVAKPMTKVIVRHLPPKLTEAEFLEAVDPLPENDYVRFVQGDETLGNQGFARAYINFAKVEDLYLFKEKFDGYIFIDNKGNESQCFVEFAPFQKVPNLSKRTKKDAKVNTIDEDADFVSFVEELQGERPLETPETFLEMIEKQEEELKLKETSTNLLQFMREKKEEKYRQRMEKVEARKRDIERRKAKRDEEKRERGGSKKNKDYGGSKSNRGDDYDESEDKSDEYYHSRNRDYYEKRPKEPKKFVGRCFKCGVEGHKGTDCPGNDCPTKDEAADEQKTDKQSGKYDKKSFKEKRKEYRSHERKYENNPEAISEDHVPSSASSSSSYKPKKIAGRCFKCGEEGHKKDECPTKDEVMDERKTDKQSGKYERKKEKKKFRDEKKEASVTQKSERYKEDKENKVQETPQKSDEDWEKIKKEKEERRKQKEKERLERLEKKPKYKERPERQIYRPGMGKFSSQTISKNEEDEKEDKSNEEPHDTSATPGKKYSKTKSLKNKDSGVGPKTNKAENYDETENKPEEYEKKPKSWKNSKH